MRDTVKSCPIIAVDEYGARSAFAKVCVEDCISIMVDSVPAIHLKATPDDIEALTVGHLVCEGIVPSFEAIESISIDYPFIWVSASEINKEVIRAQAEIRSSGMGLRLSSECRGAPLGRGIKIDLDTLFEGTRRVHQASPIWKNTGGTHCTVLLDEEGGVLSAAEDIGRHNSIDKAVGKALMGECNLERCFMVCTGRMPADIVAKAYRAGISILVSNNAPFVSGIEFAERMNMTLAGFARPPRVSIYTCPTRIHIPSASRDSA